MAAFVEAGQLLAVVLGVLAQEVRGQNRDVFAAVAQGGQAEFDGVEAEEQILAEFALGHVFGDVGIGGREDAHIHAAGLGRSHALELAGLERAQEFGLQSLRDVGDFVQEEGAAVGHFEAAHAVALGVGEGALDVAEQLAFEDALGQTAGIHGDERAGGAQGDGVQGLRDQSLAGAVFAGDEDVGVGGADTRDHVEHRAHGGRLGDQLRKALGAQRAVLRFQALSAAQGAAEFDLRLQNGRQARVVPRLLDEIARAAAHGFDGEFDAAPRGHDDHGQRGVESLDAVEEFEAFLPAGGVAGVVEVHENGVEIARFHFVDDGGGRVDGNGPVAFALHEEAQRFENIRLIVGNQDARGAGFGRFHQSLSRAVTELQGHLRCQLLCTCSVSGYYYSSTAASVR